MRLLHLLDVLNSTAASLVRGATHVYVGELGPRPEKTLELYEFESCPYCRKVREALSILDLDARIHPCPKGGTRFRPELRERGGKEQFPYLVDPNTGTEMYESSEIVRYLFRSYGSGGPSWWLSIDPLVDLTSSLATAIRLGRGTWVRPSHVPDQPLELWSYESSPFSRLVRETLCTLEIPYVLHNVAKGSARRATFVERSGKMQVPYLADPNLGIEVFESADIVRYLEQTYGGVIEPAADQTRRAASEG